MMHGHKPSLAIAIGVPKHPESEGDMDEDMGPDDDEMHAAKLDAAEALIEAIEAKDKAGVVKAFEHLAQMCGGEGPEEEPEEEG